MGSCACYHLAKRGAKILGLERHAIPNGEAAHHGHSRIIRLAYFEHPDYVPLLRRAYENWEDLAQASGVKLLHKVGGVYMGAPNSTLIAGSLKAMLEHGIPHERLTRQQVLDRYPMFRLPEHWEGLTEPDTGFIIPELAVSAFTDRALRYGADLHGHEAVLDWEQTEHGVSVRTDRKRYEADKLLFTAGAWSNRLMKDLGVQLSVTRQVFAWVWPRRPELFAYGRFPVWIIEPDGLDGQVYGFPMMPDRPGFKVGLHKPATPTDPDSFEREPMPGDEDTYRPTLKAHIPDANGQLLSLQACLYANSPDGHFIMDQHPTCHRVVVGCGFSGHGFKFASAIGEALADLTQHGKSDLPIEFLGLSRFQGASTAQD
jgi:sarcosine oxidase